MRKFFLEFFSQPLFKLLHENVTGTNDQYSRPTSIKNGQLADGDNPKYTLRHGLGWGFQWVLPQGHVKVILLRSNHPKRVRIFTFCCFCFNNVLI